MKSIKVNFKNHKILVPIKTPNIEIYHALKKLWLSNCEFMLYQFPIKIKTAIKNNEEIYLFHLDSDWRIQLY